MPLMKIKPSPIKTMFLAFKKLAGTKQSEKIKVQNRDIQPLTNTITAIIIRTIGIMEKYCSTI
jgi:hypothetical protein